jgi:HAD superfamily hydrolase (TIGR01509 family)
LANGTRHGAVRHEMPTSPCTLVTDPSADRPIGGVRFGGIVRPVSRFQAFIFDMDGVLVDSERPSLRLLQRMLADAGVHRDPRALRAVCGRPAGYLHGFLGDCFAHDEVAVERFLREYAEGKLTQLASGDVRVFPRAHEVLTALRDGGTKLALATSTARDLALRRLSHHDLVRHFDSIVTGDQIPNGKPAPDIFLHAARELGVDPRRCVVVEDSVVGVAAGRAAGMTVFAIAATFPPAELEDADRVFDDMAELEAFIAGV